MKSVVTMLLFICSVGSILSAQPPVNNHSPDPRLPEAKVTVRKSKVVTPAVKPIDEQNYPVPVREEMVKDTLFYKGQKGNFKRSAPGDEFLERLPGFTIENDGTITYMGMPFRKLRIDGVEIAPENYLSVLQELRVSRILTVEVFYDETETARRTGIFDGQWDRTLNIITTPLTKHESNADALVAYGSEGRYELRGGGTYTSGSNKYLINVSSTNTNSYAQMDRTDFVGRGIPYTGEMDRQNGSFNLQNTLSPKVTGVGSIFFNNAWYEGNIETNRTEFYSNKFNYLETSSDQEANIRDVGANYKFTFQLDPLSTLAVTPTFTYGKQYTLRNDSTDQLTLIEKEDDIDYSITNTQVLDLLDKENLVGELSAEYTRQFKKPGRRLTVRMGGRFNTVSGDGSTKNLQAKYLIDDIEDLDNLVIPMDTLSKAARTYTVSEQNNSFSGTVTYNEPLFHPNNSLQLVYSGNNSRNETSRQTRIWDFRRNEYVTDTSGCRRNVYNIYTQSISLNYQMDRRNMNLLFGAKVEMNGSQNDAYDLGKPPSSGLGQYLVNLSPNLRFSYRMGALGDWTAEYNGVTIQPTNQQLLRVADRNDPRKIIVGNPDLKPAYRHTARVVYSRSNKERKSSLTAEAVWHMTQNQMVNRDRYDSVSQTSRLTWMNVNGVWDVLGRVTYDLPYRNKRFGILLKADASYARNEISINNKPDIYYGTIVNASATQRFTIEKLLEVGVRASVNYFRVINTDETAFNRNTVDLTTGCYVSTLLPFEIQLSSDYKFVNSFGYFDDFMDIDSSDQDFHRSVWNIALNKSFLRQKRGTVTFRWNDILNDFVPFYRVYNNNILEDRYYNSIVSSYVLLSFSYKW